MAWLAFTKKAQIRNIALDELKYLLRMLEMTSGVPTNFWHDPYSVGFVFGYIMGAGLYVAGKKVNAADVTKAGVDVIFELAPQHAIEIARRFSELNELDDSQFNEGQTNGTILALFLSRPQAVEKEPIVIEARRISQSIGSALDSLPSASKTDAHGKVAFALTKMIFYDKIQTLN